MSTPLPVKNSRPSPWRLLLLLVIPAAGAALAWLASGLMPAKFEGGPAQTVEIPYGSGMRRVASILKQRGLLRDATAFRIWAKLTGGEDEIKAGSYLLDPGMSAPRILGVLTDGREMTVRVTIPEGSTAAEIAAIMDRHGLSEARTFLELTKDPAFVREVVPEAGDSLEGFLFPDTYFFSRTAGAEGAIRMMTARFQQVFTPEMRQRAKEMRRSLREIVTMASIVEEEAMRAEDRPRVAGVFYNRLRIGMPLQSCATVQYALGERKERLLFEDLQVSSPYNTYIRYGLPPGPIGNPGLASLRAALYPEQTNYLYFVAKPDGSHVFSATYREHLRAQKEISRGQR